MIFSSIEFIFLFLPILLGSIFLFPDYKKIILILFSVLFLFIAEGFFILTVSFLALFNFLLVKLELSKFRLGIGIFINLSILFIYKYLNFFNSLFNFTDKIIIVALPLGISFITFHAISYLVDVYRKKVPVEKSFSDFYLFMFMFPQVIAGPITRYSNVYKKIKILSNKYYNLGIYYFILGLSQKILIADQLGQYVDEVYSLPVIFISSFDSFFVMFLYMLQLYYDFSGYTNMAIGLGFFIGVKLPINFKFPFSSYSISEFWHRWHISLSSFIRDYLFIPINKVFGISKNENSLRYYFSILFCFILSGLWHGANLTFVLWGLIHGALVVFEKILKVNRRDIFSKIYFILALCISFVYFRSENITYANNLIANIINLNSSENYIFLQFINAKLSFILLASVIFADKYCCLLARNILRKLNNSKIIYFLLIPLCYILVNEMLINSFKPFIYFRF